MYASISIAETDVVRLYEILGDDIVPGLGEVDNGVVAARPNHHPFLLLTTLLRTKNERNIHLSINRSLKKKIQIFSFCNEIGIFDL